MVESAADLKFEIGHVLFIDIVGYSRLLINDQTDLIRRLNEVVCQSEQFRLAEAESKLIRLPTGDGMALVFRNSPEAPAQCALEIAEVLKNDPKIRLRMGIHSGPVNEVADVNERENFAGAGINLAQRVMDCGDAGHILLSKHVAEDLEHYARWQPHLHELGECEVKHGVHLTVVNLFTNELGNPQIPTKLKTLGQNEGVSSRATAASQKSKQSRWRPIAGLLLLAAALVIGVLIVSRVFSVFTSRLGASAHGRTSYAGKSYEGAKWSKIYGTDRLFPAKASFHNVTGWSRKNLIITGDLADGQLLLRLQNGEWKVNRPEKLAGPGGITACRMVGENRFIHIRAIRRGVAELDLWEANASRKLGNVPAGSSLYALAPDIFCGMEERLGYWKYSGNALQQFEKTAQESFVLRDDNVVAQIKNPKWNKDEPMLVANIRDVNVFANGKAFGLWTTASGNCATVRYRDARWYLVIEVTGFAPRNVPNKAWFLDEKNFVAIGSDKVGRCVDGKLLLQNLEVGGYEYPANELSIVWGRDLNHYWTADLRGNVFAFDGTQWRLIVRGPELKETNKFQALWPAPDGSVIGVTADEVYALE